MKRQEPQHKAVLETQRTATAVRAQRWTQVPLLLHLRTPALPIIIQNQMMLHGSGGLRAGRRLLW